MASKAISQSVKVKEVSASRGKIFSSDGFPLVLNKKTFSLFAWLPEVKLEPKRLAAELAMVLPEKKEEIKGRLEEKKEVKWVCLGKKLTLAQKKAIEELGVSGLSFEEEETRFYPEASLSAHLLGFLGQDEMGRPKGYFGLEGFYDRQLQGQVGLESEEDGFLGRLGSFWQESFKKGSKTGRNLYLFLDRTVQFLVEKELEKGIEKYGAKSGWAVVLDPKTGGVIASAAYPNYHPEIYSQFEAHLYLNPVVAESFEPGSIFKPLIMAAALEEKAVSLEDECEICSGPVVLGDYQIETWNKKYYPRSTPNQIIEHSDNVGMVWVGKKLGLDSLLEYFEKFGLDQETGIDLEEEITPPLRAKKEWSPIDLATASFGQGVAVTPIQLVTAFAILANEGRILTPRVVAKIEQGDKVWQFQPKPGKRVLSQETVKAVKEMLINAVEKGEAKWAKPEGFSIAGKTGTAQIPIRGHYDKEKTIASFIGFAPADEPKFVMLVSLREPSSSPWGAETAAPLWFSMAEKLFYYWGISPG